MTARSSSPSRLFRQRPGAHPAVALFLALPLALAAALAVTPQEAMADKGDLVFDGTGSVGRDVVPPDIIDATANQDRIFTELETAMRLSYDTGPVIVRGLAGASVYPAEAGYNRYSAGLEAQYDIALADRKRVFLRFIPGIDHVSGDRGRVYDRVRFDTQLIMRHSPEHVTTLRLRYGYRDQDETTFTGYDQSQWTGELRHVWRPGNGRTRISTSVLGMHFDAEDGRFSYDGVGTLILARTPIGKDWMAYGRFNLVRREYSDPFSAAYSYPRKDTQLRATAGLERPIGQRLSLFGEGGIAHNRSNVPTRRYQGFVGSIGIRWTMPLASRGGS